MAKSIHIELTEDEALVLFEYLAHSESQKSLAVQDQSEERVLWSVQGQLERQLVAIFDANYVSLVSAARDRVRDAPIR